VESLLLYVALLFAVPLTVVCALIAHSAERRVGRASVFAAGAYLLVLAAAFPFMWVGHGDNFIAMAVEGFGGLFMPRRLGFTVYSLVLGVLLHFALALLVARLIGIVFNRRRLAHGKLQA